MRFLVKEYWAAAMWKIWGLFAGFALVLIILSIILSTPKHKSISNSYPTYPDTNLTPGDVLSVSTEEICKSGYTGKVRDVSKSVRKEVFREYGLSYPPHKGEYEVDHFIPLELGGSNDIKNLWPEPAEPWPGFHQKDVVENYLHRQVCSGQMPLKEAQELIRKNWLEVFTIYQDSHQQYHGR